MYHKILVAIDRSPISERVFETGLALAKALDSQLMLLHILSRESQDSPTYFPDSCESYHQENCNTWESFEEKWETFKQESLLLLQQWSDRANRQGVKTEFTQLIGNPAFLIVTFSQDWGAELIVMGRKGQSTLQDILLGSVSSYVIHRSHCAVHLVNGGNRVRTSQAGHLG